MEIRAANFATELPRHPLARAYILAGPEPLQVMEAADAVRSRARQEGFDERDVLHAESGFDWRQLARTGASQSLFAARRLIEVHLSDKGPGNPGSKAIQDFVKQSAADTLLLVIAPGITASARKAAWYKAVAKAGVVSFAWPLPASQLGTWIKKRAQKAQLSLSPEAAQLLATRNEGNLLAAAQEIDRLALLFPGQKVDHDDVIETAGDHARFDIFDLPSKAVSGDGAGALRSLYRLRDEGIDTVLITWAIVNNLRTLYQAARAARSNQLDSYMRKLFMPPAHKRQIASVARRADPAHLSRLLQQAARADAINKGARSGRIWDELATLLLGLARPDASTGTLPTSSFNNSTP